MFWNLVNFPSLPCVFGYVMLSPPPFESEVRSWDYIMLGVSLISSCLMWGAIGAGIAKLTTQRSAA